MAEIETDKATFEVTAPADGTRAGDVLRGRRPGAGVHEPLCHRRGGRERRCLPASGGRGRRQARRQRRRRPPRHPRRRRRSARRRRPAPAAPAGSLSPRARRFAAEHDFHPAAVTGSGPGGRVLEEDLRKQYYCIAASVLSGEASASRRAWRLAARVRERPAWSFPATWFRRRPAYPASARRSRGACGSRWPPPRSIRCIHRPTRAACSWCAPRSRLPRACRISISTTW